MANNSNTSKKAFAPTQPKKPMFMRILVLALVAVLFLGIVIGAVANAVG